MKELFINRISYLSVMLTLLFTAPVMAADGAAAAAEPAAEPANEGPVDLFAADALEQINKKHGFRIPKNYDVNRFIKGFALKTDSRLPTGIIDAVQKGEPYVSLWEAEMALADENDAAIEKILTKIEKQHPKEARTYWLWSKHLMFKAERLPMTDKDGRDKMYKRGQAYAQKCKNLDSKNIGCVLHYGALTARIMTNSGIWSAIRNAGKVEKAFIYSSKLGDMGQHYRFPSGNTMAGAANYALGIMYRMAPHGWFMKLLSPVDGDFDKSIKYHKKAIRTNPFEVETYTELGATYLCKGLDEDEKKYTDLGIKTLKKCRTLTPGGSASKVSYADCNRLMKDHKLCWGYSRDGQQETDADKIKATVEKNK